MKLIKTEDAVGHVLCHDITQIIKGVTKDAVFRKGHIVTEEDIPVLLSVGKENLYVWEKEEGMLHENDAAEILRQICQGEHMHPSDVKEGKIELIADIDGVLKIEREKLRKVNSLGEIMIASRHGDFPVKKGDKLAGTRVIPLVISEEKMQQAFESLYEQAEKSLSAIDFDKYDEILFVAKSVGTIIASAYAEKHSIRCRQILYTPLKYTYNFAHREAIAFIGTSDPWSIVSEVQAFSQKQQVPMYTYENANHSLETTDTLENLKILQDVMGKTKGFLERK